MFTVTPKKDRKLLIVRLSGFFTVEEVGDLARTLQGAVQEMGCGWGDWLHLCDISDISLQSQEVAKAFSTVVNHPVRRSHRLAIVTGRTTARMQIRRVLTRSDAALFETRAEAEGWLFEDEARWTKAVARPSLSSSLNFG